MNNCRYTPVSLQDLCMNKIISLYWNQDFDSILIHLPIFLQEDYWKEKIKKRHEIIKICL
jgi:hypothetical protein